MRDVRTNTVCKHDSEGQNCKKLDINKETR